MRRELTRRAALAAALASGCAPASGRADAGRPQPVSEALLTGINLAGLEFNASRTPGRADRDYVAPRAAEFSYYAARGANVIRLPFLWERMQPRLDGGFDPAYAALIDAAAAEARAHGMHIVLDAHQYGRRRESGAAHIIGEGDAVTAAHFSRFWGAMAQRYRDDAIIFGLINEPHDQDMDALVRTQNAAIAAIRGQGSTQLILASGNAWSGAHSWISRGNGEAMRGIEDPRDNFAFDVHQYLDRDSSGRSGACITGASARLQPFTQWARRHRRRGFLGEFGAGASDGCTQELDALLMQVNESRDVWLGWSYWAGGPWWPREYHFAITPHELEAAPDRPQMRVLRRFFGAAR